MQDDSQHAAALFEVVCRMEPQALAPRLAQFRCAALHDDAAQALKLGRDCLARADLAGDFDAQGEACEIGGDGLLAVQLQHEFDHLQGRLIVDTLSQLRRSMARKDLADRKRKGLRYELPRDPEPAPAAVPGAPAAAPVLP